jgi:hypothetical protein
MIVEALQVLISEYLNGSSARTYETFAAKAGLSSKTLQRILSKNSDYQPNDQTIFCIVKVLFKNDQRRMLDFLTENMPQKFGVLKRIYDLAEYDVSKGPDVLRTVSSNPTAYLTGALLLHDKGVTVKTLRESIGNNSIPVFQRFLEEGLLIEVSEGHYRFEQNHPGAFDGEILKGLTRQALEQYDPKDFGTENALIHHGTRFLSKEGRNKIRDRALQFIEDVSIIAEENPGDEAATMFLGLVKLIRDEKGENP